MLILQSGVIYNPPDWSISICNALKGIYNVLLGIRRIINADTPRKRISNHASTALQAVNKTQCSPMPLGIYSMK